LSEISATRAPRAAAGGTAFAVLATISICHMLNDTMQSLLPAIYPMLKSGFQLDFSQVGLITLTFQLTASLLQPAVGLYTDRHPLPYSLAIGMGFTLAGLLLLSVAGSFPELLLAAALVGMGSSVFHPESSRVARMASGGRHGLAQSLFQVGGNAGAAAGPLLAAFIVLPRGQGAVAWFALVALLGIFLLANIGRWYKRTRTAHTRSRGTAEEHRPALPRRRVVGAIAVLLVLIFSKYPVLQGKQRLIQLRLGFFPRGLGNPSAALFVAARREPLVQLLEGAQREALFRMQAAADFTQLNALVSLAEGVPDHGGDFHMVGAGQRQPHDRRAADVVDGAMWRGGHRLFPPLRRHGVDILAARPRLA
jgi:MFS family permease